MCHLYPYKNVKLLWKFFTLIFSVLLVRTNFYTKPDYLTIPISVLKFTSDSTEITAGGHKIALESPAPLDAP